MDSESCVHQTNESPDSTQKPSVPLDGMEDAKLNNPKVEPSLAPITPEPNKENGDFPLAIVKKLPKVHSFNSKTNRSEDQFSSPHDSSSPLTPKDGVFDPFAPGPECMGLAPLCKKFDEARANVARRLDFSSSVKCLFQNSSCDDDVESLSDEEMFESVYENLLEAIVSKQTEGALAEISTIEWDDDACWTPPSAPRLNGIAETCPGAPVKPIGKSRIIDIVSCKKLDF